MPRGPMKEPTKDSLRQENARLQRDLLRAEGQIDAYRDVAMNRGSAASEETSRPRRLRRIK